jgi:hypothetical protein
VGYFALKIKMHLSQQIDKVEYITTKDFKNEYLLPQKPLVIKSISPGATAFKNWNTNYLKKSVGNLTVDVHDNRIKNSSTTSITKADKKIPFSDYLDIIEANNESDYRIFLFNLFKEKPHLRNDFPCPDIFNGLLDKIGYTFFGAKNSNVRIHYDIDNCNVLHTQFLGRKKITLFSPDYSELLYQLPFTTHSIVDFQKIDFEKYPAVKFVKGYEFILQPGETLFMPSGFWHYMQYIDAGFAVSYRKLPVRFSDTLNGINNILFNLPFDKSMNYLWPQQWSSYKINESHRKANHILKNYYPMSVS